MPAEKMAQSVLASSVVGMKRTLERTPDLTPDLLVFTNEIFNNHV